MANRLYTTFQNMSKVFNGTWATSNGIANLETEKKPEDVLFTTDDPVKYHEKKLELQQNKYLQDRWVRANQDLSMSAFSNLSNIKLMYRDADLMDSYPEIGAALDLCSEECVQPNPNNGGQIVNVTSKSDRIRSILEDLFVNRLNLQVSAQMVIRAMCKYGNQFMLLDIDKGLGVKGWRQLPVGEVERIENGIVNPYGVTSSVGMATGVGAKDTSTKFMWTSESGGDLVPFRNWQIAHFRLLHNSMFLPYGVSMLSAARRHFRMLALLEDSMLIYRLSNSMERKLFKIYVGALDDEDIPGYIEQIANQFKRTPIVDPMTGQLDLRKNILPVWKKTPIPLLDGRTISIEELAKEFEEGKTNYVYSIQDKTHEIVPGKVVWCGKNYNAESLYKITLDDDSYMVMAGEHEIIMRDGTKKRADEIVSGESVMPFYITNCKLGGKCTHLYEKIYNPSSGKYEFTHKLIAKSLDKFDKQNTIHHKNFNQLDNNPENLQWMTWEEHRNYHNQLAHDGRLQELRRKVNKEKWLADGYREMMSKKCKISFDNYVWGEIEDAVIRGEIYTQHGATKYINENLFEYLKSINTSPKLNRFKSISEITVQQRTKDCGFKNFDEYLTYVENKHNLKPHKERLREYRSIQAKKLNYAKNLGENWILNSSKEVVSEYLKKINDLAADYHRVKISDNVWADVRDGIIQKKLKYGKDIIEFINNNHIEEIKNINQCPVNKISERVLRSRIQEMGFKNISEYISSMSKNHKVKSIEIINGDDVYCMTVEGLNGENDRHNFALKTFVTNNVVSESGVFVSNCATDDWFVPTRDPSLPNPIETLPAGKNLDTIDDIKYIQKKVCAALRIPQSFLNFEEATGDGKNLALMDVRFARTINRFQQAFLMELTKIATIHLYLLGFEDDLTNFNLSMNNPSTQAEQLELENLQKKISIMRDAVSDPGNGIPVMSAQEAWKRILKLSDNEIKEMLEQIRLEKALAAEYEKTSQIIKRSGIFDSVDRIYGEPGAEYLDDNGGNMGENGGGMPGGGGGMPGGMDELGGPGGDIGEIQGEEGMEPIGDMNPADVGPEPQGQPMESTNKKGSLITEQSLTKHEVRANKLFNQIVENMNSKKKEEIQVPRVDVYDKNLMINEEMDSVINKLDDLLNDSLDEILIENEK